MRNLLPLPLLLAAADVSAVDTPRGPAKDTKLATFFDDFTYADEAALAQNDWTVRTAAGLPGIEGARWGEGTIALVDDAARPGNRFLRLVAGTDGTPEGTRQAQVCHARKYLEGTYAARVRFADAPVSGPDVDETVLTFYTLSAYVRDLDPLYSELDFEYLPNGGWKERGPTLFNTSWETFQMKPWRAFNQQNRLRRSQQGWHTLVTQVAAGKIRYFLDGVQIAEHGGKVHPRVPMSINFNLWFIVAGWKKSERTARVWDQDVDWVFHAQGRALAPAAVEAEVDALRQAGTAHVDTVPPADPPLPSLCNL